MFARVVCLVLMFETYIIDTELLVFASRIYDRKLKLETFLEGRKTILSISSICIGCMFGLNI